MNNSYIKILRKLTEWEWYKRSEIVHLFIHLLLKANFVNGKFQGVEVKRGQLITGLNTLSESTGITVQSIRTGLKALKSTGEITIQSTNRFSLVTIINYDIYQSFDAKPTSKSTSKLTNKQQSTNKQLTTIEEEEEGNKEKNIFRAFKHLSISVEENNKLINLGYDQIQINDIYNRIENHKKNTNYSSLYLTAINWLKIQYPSVTKGKLIKTKYTEEQLRKARNYWSMDRILPDFFDKNDLHLIE